ncbi:TonB-dependent receptor [Coleofasciculus sp.]|uniref:TonB-dependent receptor n=1 Tax=Coleofasciculus sp. TaxID=3100458 RepID=UPI003A3C48E8
MFGWSLTGLITVAIASASSAIAQTPSPDANLEVEEEIEIIVTDEILNQPVYAPFRREATVRDSTRPVYVINREQIEAQGARTVQEALKYLPGILSDGTAGGQLGALSSQFIRGSNSAQVLILLDGRPINDVGFFGGFDLSEFTADNIERIELLPGGGSTLYGSDALGGVINIITRSPSDKPEVTLRTAAGSFGLNEQAIQTRGRSSGIGWTVGYTRTEANNDFPFEIDRINLTDFLNYNYNNPDPNTFGTQDEVNRRAIGLQVQHNWQVAKNQTLTYGADYRNTRSRNTTFSYGTNSTEVNYDGDITQGALFARYEVNFTPSFSVNLGLRQDFNSLVNGSFTSPSVGARLALSNSTTLRANYARSFRGPQISNLEGLAAFNVVGNPDLKPERGDSFDIGIDQELGKIGLLRLTLFSNTISDLINFKFGSPSTYENIGKVRTLGLESALNLQLARHLYAFANYTLNDPRIVRDRNPDIEDNRLSFRDADQVNFGLAYETPAGLYTGIILRHLSSYFVNNTNTESLPGYTTVDLKLRIPLGRTVVLNGNLDNLFDEQYEQYPGYPAVGRSFRLGISTTF